MKIVKAIAKRILRKELKIQRETNQELCQKLEEARKTVAYYENKEECKKQIIISKEILNCILKILPNPNKLANGILTPEELTYCNSVFLSEEIGGIEYDFKIFISRVSEKEAVIKVFDDVEIKIPLKKTKTLLFVYGVSTEIESYSWDFNNSNIQIVDDEDWKRIREFVFAQSRALQDFRVQGLL